MLDVLVKIIVGFVQDKREEEKARAREEEAIRQADNWSDAEKEAFKIITKQKSG